MPDDPKPKTSMMKKKVLGLPMPVVLIGGGVLAYLLYRKYKGNQTSATSVPTDTTPTVGQPSGDGGGSGGGSSGGSTPPPGSTGTTGTGVDFTGTGMTLTSTDPSLASTTSTPYIPTGEPVGVNTLNSTAAGFGTYQIPRRTFGL